MVGARPQSWPGGQGAGARRGGTEQTCVVFLTFLTRTKRRKIAFFEGFPVGWGRVQGGAERGPRALVPGGQVVISQTFLTCTKRRKMACFEGCPVGCGRVKRLGRGVQGLWFRGGRW